VRIWRSIFPSFVTKTSQVLTMMLKQGLTQRIRRKFKAKLSRMGF